MSPADTTVGNRGTTRALQAAAMFVALVLAWRAIVLGADAWIGGGYATTGGRAPPPASGASPDAPWRARLAQQPADHAALTVLALALEREGDAAGARAAMTEALRLAPSDRQTLLEAGAFALRTGDESGALETLQRVADLYPDAWGKLWPAFTAMLDGGAHAGAFAAIARANPPWWGAFFDHACRNAAKVDAVEQVFVARAAAGNAGASERRCVIDRLAHDGHWARAYQAWLNSLPPEHRRRVGYVFNGDFGWPVSNLGFDWTTPRRNGVLAEVRAGGGASDRRALAIEFVDARWSGPPVQQNLMLPPGRYRFEGRGRAERLQTWLGVQWGLYCLPLPGAGERQLVRTEPFRGRSAWEGWDLAFAVPKDCPVQLLRLELANPKADAETPGNVAARLDGVVWFDDFRIRSLD